MQKIVPSIWFDQTAGEAAKFYTSVFPNARGCPSFSNSSRARS